MKKVLLVIALAAIIATGTAFADHPSGFGIGVQGGYSGAWGGAGFGGGALSLKLPGIPIFWAIRADIMDGSFGLGISGDYYFIDARIAGPLHWYLGAGFGLGFSISDSFFGLGLSARLPIGLSIQPIPLLEIFLQAVPSLGVSVVPEFHFPYGGWGGDLGIRLWF